MKLFTSERLTIHDFKYIDHMANAASTMSTQVILTAMI